MATVDLEARKSGIGGSDAASIMGVSPYKSGYRLWEEKCGFRQEEDLSDKESVLWGGVHEKAIIAEYAKRNGVIIGANNEKFVHATFEWMFCHIDGAFYTCEKRPGAWSNIVGLEVKTVDKDAYRNGDWGEPGSDQIPEHYKMQVMHNLAVTGFYKFDVPVLVGGNNLVSYTVYPDEQLIKQIIEAEQRFWGHVMSKTPPACNTSEDAKQKYPLVLKAFVDASPLIAGIAKDLKNIKTNIKQLQKKADEYQAQIQDYMGNANRLDYNGKTIATWSMVDRKDVDLSALRGAYPDLVVTHTKTSASRRFVLK